MAWQIESYLKNNDGSVNYADMSFTFNDLIENGDIQTGQLLDNSNVYAIFNPSKYPHLVPGAGYSRYQIQMDENASTSIHQLAVRFENHQPQKINLRYLYPHTALSNIGGTTVINWNMSDSEKSIYLNLAKNPNASSDFYAPFSGNRNIIRNSSYNYTSLNYRYFLDIDRTQLMYVFRLQFFYIDDNNKIVLLDIPDSDVIAHLRSNDEQFIYNGRVVYPANIQYRPIWKQSAYLFENGNISNASSYAFPFMTAETYFNDKLVQINTGPQTSLMSTQELNFVNSGFTLNWQAQRTWDNPIYNGIYTCSSVFGYGALTDGNEPENFLSGYTPYPTPDEIDFQDEFFENYNPNGNNPAEIYVRGNQFYILTYISRDSFQRSKCLSIVPIYTTKDICRQFALTLIPFCYKSTNFNFPNSTDYVLIGIRDDDNCVSGNYQNYNWDDPQTETKFRPDDFVPLVPKPGGDQPETDDGGNTRSGNSIALRAPTNLAGCAGFVTNYCLTNDQMQRFGAALWANFNDSAFWQALGAVLTDSLSIDPADILKYIISLRCFPIDLISTGIVTTDKFYIGRGTVGIDLGSSVAYTTDMTIFKSCGSVTIPEYNHNYLDYSPYRTISIYLPFCGEFELNATDVSGSVITVHYAIDLTTGICTAFVLSNYQNVEYPVLTVSGQMGQDIQLTAGNLAPVAVSLATAVISGFAGEISGGIAGGMAGIKLGNKYAAMGGAGIGAATGGINGFMNNFESGNRPTQCNPGASFNAFYAPMTPYIKIKSSRTQKPINFSSTQGNITLRSRAIGEMSGFVQVINPDCSGIPATQDELDMIKSTLENGIHI